ncbi:MAG TPA: hypothetical protein VFF65_12680, partial [Phycisphaerales bacterium]|nr:hypothetical protein [Phycisphaerales bacterium]
VEIASPGAQRVPANAVSAGWIVGDTGSLLAPPPRTPLADWYVREPDGSVRLALPKWLGDGGIATRAAGGGPFVPWVVAPGTQGGGLRVSMIQGQRMAQYPYTPQQEAALIKLAATLCQVLPGIKPVCPREEDGRVSSAKLPDDRLTKFQGILGHYHIQTDKTDPGPALDFDALISATRRELDRRR